MEEHPSPGAVTVTAKTVDITVVVAHEVTVAFAPGHCPVFVDAGSDSERVPVPAVVDVEDSDDEVELGLFEDAEDGLVTPHSSRLWSCAGVRRLHVKLFGSTYILTTPHLSAKLIPCAVISSLAGSCSSQH